MLMLQIIDRCIIHSYIVYTKIYTYMPRYTAGSSTILTATLPLLFPSMAVVEQHQDINVKEMCEGSLCEDMLSILLCNVLP